MRTAADELYSVESDTDETVLFAVGMRLRTERTGEVVEWHDSVRFRVKYGRVKENQSDRWVFESSQGHTYTFRPLTLPYFRSQVLSTVEGDVPASSLAAVRQFYLEEFVRD